MLIFCFLILLSATIKLAPPTPPKKIIEKQTQLYCKLLEEQGHFILFSRSTLELRGYLILEKEVDRCWKALMCNDSDA